MAPQKLSNYKQGQGQCHGGEEAVKIRRGRGRPKKVAVTVNPEPEEAIVPGTGSEAANESGTMTAIDNEGMPAVADIDEELLRAEKFHIFKRKQLAIFLTKLLVDKFVKDNFPEQIRSPRGPRSRAQK